MAQRFLDQLVKIPEGELPKDSCCVICRRDYGTVAVDAAVRLPCKHHVGLECISIWLSPDRDSKNSCPMCRHVFFDVIDEEEVFVEVMEEVFINAIDEQEEQQHFREVVRRVGKARRDIPRGPPTWYDWFMEAAAEQYEESLTRANEYFVRRRDEGAREEVTEYHIASRATTFRTLAVREMMLYMEYARDGAFPPVVDPIRAPLNAEQMEALFRELKRRGAFEYDMRSFRDWENQTDEQMRLLWDRLREEGESLVIFDGIRLWSASYH